MFFLRPKQSALVVSYEQMCCLSLASGFVECYFVHDNKHLYLCVAVYSEFNQRCYVMLTFILKITYKPSLAFPAYSLGERESSCSE